MGGAASGRYRERNRGAIESFTTLDIRRLRKLGFIRPGYEASGPLHWRDEDGKELASIALKVSLPNLDGPVATGEAVLSFSYGGEARTQTIRIVGRPMRYGGHRFYFVCPLRHERCERLAVVRGVFASRQAHRLTYRSQSEDLYGRLHRKSAKLEKRLYGPPPRNRPRGQNRERLAEAWVAAESELDARFAAAMMQKWGSWQQFKSALG